MHQKAGEDKIVDKCGEYGEFKRIHLDINRKAGFLKGYALVEYEIYPESQAKMENLNGSDLLGEKINVDCLY